jgi:hypothetical protein
LLPISELKPSSLVKASLITEQPFNETIEVTLSSDVIRKPNIVNREIKYQTKYRSILQL